MSGHTWVAVPHAALRVAGRDAGRRLGVLDLYERADAVRYDWLTWTEREFADAWGVHRRAVVSLLADLESHGLLEVKRAKPHTRAASSLRVVKIGRYRADLVVGKLVIECDGHEYHSSREQRTRDAARDRAIMLAGYRVARFTGSEIYADASACARQVAALVKT